VQTVKERLDVYKKQTAPLEDYYKKQGKLINVDGNQSIEKVFADIVKVLG
jgi:adenylate kinase